MIDVKCKIEVATKKVTEAIDKAAYKNFGHAAASIRKEAIASIQKAPKEDRTRAKRRKGVMVRRARHASSQPGKPPFTGRGQIKRAIVFSANKEGAVIGPKYSVMGTAAEAHEFGGSYKGGSYPSRPFMFPALQRQVSRFANSWKGSIGA